MTIAEGDLTLSGNNINLTTPTGKTYINLTNPLTGDGELVCSTYSSGGDLSISALSGGVLSLISGDNVQISCGENFFLTTNDTTGELVFVGTNLQSNSSGGSSGLYLRIKLNGVNYKIALLND
jgi:hypothetical protein